MKRFGTKKDVIGFEIANYYGASKMTITDWANALGFRYMVYSIYSRSDDQINCEHLLQQIFQKPIRISDDPKPIMFGVLGGRKSIYDINVLDLYYYFTERMNHPSMIDAKNECIKRDMLFENNYDDAEIMAKDGKLNWELLNASFMEYSKNKTGFSDNTELVRIDMTYSDDLIMNDLKKWLKVKRSTSKKYKKSVQKTDMESWSKLRVLALLDLDFYSKIYNVHFPNHVLGDLLFPDDEVDVSEKIRKTVRPLASNLFKSDFLDLLSNQANGVAVELLSAQENVKAEEK